MLRRCAVLRTAPLLVWAVVLGCADVPADEPPPNLVLVTVDTLRADHLGCYGYAQPTSPALDRFAATGVRYADAVAQAPWTLPSMASLMTSLYPSEHGAVHAESKLPESVTTLAEALRRVGYRTIGVASHAFLTERHGMSQGFEVFDETHVAGHTEITSPALTGTALELLAKHGREPYFLWVHYFDPHFTYLPHDEIEIAGPSRLPERLTHEFLEVNKDKFTPDDVRDVRDVYDEEIAFTDRAIGALFEGLAATERPPIVVFTADHGEYFLERGRFGHGKQTFRELIQVPLIVGGAISAEHRGRVVQSPVELVSVPRTLAQLAGVEATTFQGEDLLAVPDRPEVDRRVFAEGSYAWGIDQRERAVLTAHWKLVELLDDDARLLFDRRADPGELTNLADSDDPRAQAARAELEAALAEFRSRAQQVADSIRLSADEREDLRDLGYVESR